MAVTTVKEDPGGLADREPVNEDGTPAFNDEEAKSLPRSDGIFPPRLPPSVFLVRAYLLPIEDRQPHTRHPSRNTIAAAAGIFKNTVTKSIGALLEKGWILAEPSSCFDKHGLKRKRSSLYTILPVGAAMDICERQLRQSEKSVARQNADANLLRLCAAQERTSGEKRSAIPPAA